jgi:hypothetical protein
MHQYYQKRKNIIDSNIVEDKIQCKNTNEKIQIDLNRCFDCASLIN